MCITNYIPIYVFVDYTLYNIILLENSPMPLSSSETKAIEKYVLPYVCIHTCMCRQYSYKHYNI